MLFHTGKRALGSVRAAGLAAMLASASGCMTYRGPYGVEETIERKMDVELHREVGFKLGPTSTKIAASLAHHWENDQDLRDLSEIGVAVFEVAQRGVAAVQPITAKDLGVEGWQKLIDSRSDGEQIMVFAQARNGEIRDMMLLAIDDDEVVVSRLKGHLDRLIEKVVAGADNEGVHGARAAIGLGSD